jgi:hypothetical protein
MTEALEGITGDSGDDIVGGELECHGEKGANGVNGDSSDDGS